MHVPCSDVMKTLIDDLCVQPDGITSVLGDDANGLRLGQCWAMGGSNGFVEVIFPFIVNFYCRYDTPFCATSLI